MSYIEDHLFDPTLDVNQLRRSCGLPDHSVSSQFHSAIGRSPHGYIEDRRLETACRLLGKTDLKIWQISELLGYSSIQVFSRAFARWSGQRPTLYRKKARRGEGGQEPPTRAPGGFFDAVTLRRALAGELPKREASQMLERLDHLYPSSRRAAQGGRRRSVLEEARERYGELVDKEFAASLVADEERELDELKQLLDHADARFYEPIKQRLRAEIERLSSQRGESDSR